MSSSQCDVVGAYTCALTLFVALCSATLGVMLFTLTMCSFHFLFMRKPTPAWPLFALEWHIRRPPCKVVKHSSGHIRVIVCVYVFIS